MDILLLKNIKNLGEIGSKVSVKSGYARNYLIPKNYAMLPTKANLAIIDQQKQELLKKEEELRATAISQKEKFDGYVMSFEVNVQEEDDKLFGSITLQNIIDKLREDGFELEKKQVNLPSGPIKNFGEDYSINIGLHVDINVTVPIKLVKNSAPAPVSVGSAVLDTTNSSTSE